MTVDLIHFTLIQSLAVISPGPDFAIVSRNALNSGKSHGLAASLGITTAVFVHILYTAFGFSQVILTRPELLSWVKILGFLYLCSFGFNLIFSPKEKLKLKKEEQKKKNLLKSFSEGFMTNLLNPKCVLFFLSLFSTMIDPNKKQQLSMFLLIIFATTFIWFAFVSFFLARPKARSLYLEKRKLFDRVIGSFLIVMSFKLLFDSMG